jgi:hypothetical protein
MNRSGSRNRFEDENGFGASRILHAIDRASIKAQDLKPFLEFWNVQRIAQAGRLRDMFGNVLFTISVFDHDERAVYEIPSIRLFLQKLADSWPYFFWAATLEASADAAFLPTLIKCIVPNASIVVRAADPENAVVQISDEDLNTAYAKLVDGFGNMCQLDPKMNDEFYNTRLAAVSTHLKKHFRFE